MPFGAFRLNSLSRYVAAAGGPFQSLTSSTAINWNWIQYQHDKISYVGLDSSNRPVYLFGTKTSNSDAIVILFRINSDLSITEGSPVTIHSSAVSAVGTATAMSGFPDNTNGICTYYIGTNVFAKAFAMTKDTLAIGTPGTAIQISNLAPTAGFSYVTYLRNGRWGLGWRSSGINVRYATISGTTISLSANRQTTAHGDSVWQDTIGFNNSNSIYRFVTGSGNSNAIGAGYFNGTSASTGVISTNFLTMGTLTTMKVAKLDDVNKFIAASSSSTAMKIRAGTVTWPTTGTAAPTLTLGTEITSVDVPSVGTATICDGGTNQAFVVYRKASDSVWYYRKITATGTTLTEGSPVSLAVDFTNFRTVNPNIHYVAGTAAGNILVGLVDNANSNNPLIFVKVVV